MGIRYVGETTARTLAQSVHHILDFCSLSLEQLQELEDVGTKVASSIYEFFQNPVNVQLIQQLGTAGLLLVNTKKETQVVGNLSGMTFLFTGTLTALKRSEAEELVRQQGGQILSGVSAKLNYLVAGEEAGSKLEKAKKINSIHIISEAEFQKMIGQ